MRSTPTPTAPSSLFHDVATLWSHLWKDQPGHIAILLLLIVITAVVEMSMLAAIVPLVNVLMDSQVGSEGSAGSLLPESMRWVLDDLTQSQILLGVMVVVLLSAVLRILVVRTSTEFSIMVGMRLQTGYFRTVLNRDYEKVVNQSSSENVSLITQKVQLVIGNYILGMLSSLAALVSGLGVIVVLVWFSEPIVLLALLILAMSYVIIAKLTRRRLRRYGRDLQKYNPKKVQIIQEGLGGIRDVVMAGSQEHFVSRFAEVARRVEIANGRIVFFIAVPKPVLEAIGICSIAGIAWVVQRGTFSGTNLLPLLGLFALGMLRLLPYLQQMFTQWTRLIHGQAVLSELVAELDGFEGLSVPVRMSTSEALQFNSSIALENVGFSYVGSDKPVLSGLNVTINKGEYIGIVGPTGSGKSTLVDMIMGLLPPSEGVIAIDQQPLNAVNREQWRRRVAHVPQKLFLSQGSIAENIAFGVAGSVIDQARVEQCARHAHLHEFIETLPHGYATEVGEDGVRLSGGQRQRIGLARALYSQCDVLVLDEATNALDKEMERAVVEELLSLERGYTLIAIAHNLDTVTNCHRILVVGDGSAQWRS